MCSFTLLRIWHAAVNIRARENRSAPTLIEAYFPRVGGAPALTSGPRGCVVHTQKVRVLTDDRRTGGRDSGRQKASGRTAARQEVVEVTRTVSGDCRAASYPNTVRKTPEAGHVGGLQARPDEYERRVIRFFHRALLPGAEPVARDAGTASNHAPGMSCGEDERGLQWRP